MDRVNNFYNWGYVTSNYVHLKNEAQNFLEHTKMGKIRLLPRQSGFEPFGDNTILVYEFYFQ